MQNKSVFVPAGSRRRASAELIRRTACTMEIRAHLQRG